MKTINWSRNMSALPHDPQDVEDYAFGWSDWLDGETLADHEVAVDGVTLVISQISGDDVLFRISGGTANTAATVDIRVVSASGREKSRRLLFEVRDF